MALKNQPITVCYTAYDATTGLRKTGDAANHTIYVIKDGSSAPTTNAPAEVDAAHAPGEYSVSLTAAEMNANTVAVTGRSTTASVEIVPVKITTERGVLPASAAGANGGMPTVDASNRIAGIQGTKNTLDSLHDLSAAQVENAVLDADVATHHTTSGSAGERINASGSAGDPWAAALPGGYGAGTAGHLVAANLDASVSSRLAASSYTAPDNADAASAATGVADLLARLTAPRATLLDSLDHLDADVSSRLPTGGFIAPDNAAIAAIQAKTDNLPANPAATGDPMTLDMSQHVPLSNTAQTVGDALNAARAEGFGKWDLIGTTLTLYAADGATPVHAFTLNDATNPTMRA